MYRVIVLANFCFNAEACFSGRTDTTCENNDGLFDRGPGGSSIKNLSRDIGIKVILNHRGTFM